MCGAGLIRREDDRRVNSCLWLYLVSVRISYAADKSSFLVPSLYSIHSCYVVQWMTTVKMSDFGTLMDS